MPVRRLDDAGLADAAFADRELANAVARHKGMFFVERAADRSPIDYAAAVNGGLQLVPGGDAAKALEEDYGRMVEDGLAQWGVTPSVAFATNYLETIKMMVIVGLGWSVLPRTMLDGELVELRVSGLEMQRQLGVVRHTGHTLSNAAEAMLNTLREA